MSPGEASNAEERVPFDAQGDGWAVECVTAAYGDADVSAASARTLLEALQGTAGERALKAGELTALARDLLAAEDDALPAEGEGDEG